MLLVSGVQHSDSVTSMHIYVYIWASLVAQMVKNCNAGDAALILGWEDFLEKGWQPTPVFLPGKSRGQRSLAGYNLWGHKESDTTEQLTYIT